ncbi:MAG: glutamine amidotransferase [Pseudomonadota bacterium]
MRVLLVRHGNGPTDDRVVTWARAAGYDLDIRRPFQGDLLGEVEDDIAGTVIYGGMFNVYETDKNPFLNEEYRWIRACLQADLPILGICQGAQQIAHELGAWAGPREGGDHEFGYHRVDPTPEAGDFLTESLVFTQAHFHTFDLPDGAVRLARNDAYENQAFRYGKNVYGTQFHPEVTPDGFRRWQPSSVELQGLPGVQSIEEQNRLMALHDPAQDAWFRGFLDRFLGPAA